MMVTVESVREHLAGRAVARRTREALEHLARDPELSLRSIALVHRVDPGRLSRLAAEVPGLRELRPGKGGRRAA